MEENPIVSPPNQTDQDTSYNPGKQLTVGVAVTLFLVIVCFAGYYFFKGNQSGQTARDC